MVKVTFKRNGMPPKGLLFKKARRPAVMLCAMLASSLLVGCAAIPTTATTIEAQCAAWRRIRYSASKDTKMTVDQIRIHNETGRNLGCWK